jgi:CubicO group peptidase (beta-lactamase class C family)
MKIAAFIRFARSLAALGLCALAGQGLAQPPAFDAARITPRHLLNQTSGLSRADGIAPLLAGSRANIEELARGLGSLSLNRPVGERFEYSNLCCGRWR